MTKEAMRESIVRAISDSKFQIDFIDNDVDGSLVIKVSRPTKMNYHHTIAGRIRVEEDIGKFREAIAV